MESGGARPPVLGRLPSTAVIRHPAWDAARRAVAARVESGPGVVAVVGVEGVGKTTLLLTLARELARRGHAVRVAEPGETRAEGGAILLLDDADHLDDPALVMIREGSGTTILAGEPALEGRLLELGVEAAPVALRPMRPEELAEFVAARLTAAGQPPDLLTPEAVQEVFARSRGVARRVNALVGAALYGASLEDSGQVTARHVAEAAASRGHGVGGRESASITASVEVGNGVPGAEQDPLVSRPVPGATGPARTTPEDPPPVTPPLGDAHPPDLVARVVIGASGPVTDELPPPAHTHLAGEAAPTPPVETEMRATTALEEPAGLRAAAPLARRDLPRRRPPLRHAAFLALLLGAAGALAWFAVPGPRRGGGEGVVLAEWTEPPPRDAPSVMVPMEAAAPATMPATLPAPPPETSARTTTNIPARAPVPPAPRPAAASSPPPVPASSGGPRVVLHRPLGSASAEASAEGATAILASGFGPVETRVVGSAPRVPTIRYFHEGDSATAGRVARSLPGGPWRVQDMTAFRPLPRTGTVEVWFP